jgi:competence protein ComEA
MTRIGFAILALILAIAGVYAAFRAFDQRAAPPIVIADSSVSQPLTVEVRGAVTTPGVYELPAGSRVQDAVEAAGGLGLTADLSTINLARRVRDGEVIVVAAVPTIGATAVVTEITGSSADSGPSSTQKVNINTATASELESLPGIGKVTAQRIIAFREANGPFHAVDDLVQIQGISTRTVESLRDLITTGP